MLVVESLAFSRNDAFIFNNINFRLELGELLQVIGANGCGKTTLLRVLSRLATASEGKISWDNADISRTLYQYRASFLYMGHFCGIKPELTVMENIQLMLAYTASTVIVSPQSAIIKVGLAGYENKQAAALSAGQKRRLALTRLILLKSTLWLLDEPFAALDKQGIELVEELIVAHVNQRGIVIFTSHQPFKFSQPLAKEIFLRMQVS